MMKLYYGLILLTAVFTKNICAQNGDVTYHPNIRTTKLYKTGDQTSFPALALNKGETLELHFDDLDADVKTYYYSFQLCNADWSPSILRTPEYTRGFQNVRITNYRNSSLSLVRYTHYQALVPDRNSYPTRSGNYLLKVFLNGDTSKVAFTKRFVVVEMKSAIAAQILQPFNATLYNNAQKLQIGVQTETKVQLLSPTDLKIVALQNNSWLTSISLDRPTITRGHYFEYSDEAQNSFAAIKEFRWVDLRSFRLKGDHILTLDAKRNSTEITVVPDAPRATQVYSYYRDLNGRYTVENVDNPNPFVNGDYATVHFRYFPPGNRAIEGQNMYLFGEFTNYGADTSGIMTFNAERGAYEKTLFLKQGYYNYTYGTMPIGKKGYPDFGQSEGNYWATENAYIILVYYRPFGARADELIGFTWLNSAFQRP